MVFESDINIGAYFVIYSGDWNVTINHELDNKNYIHVNNPKPRAVINNIMAQWIS